MLQFLNALLFNSYVVYLKSLAHNSTADNKIFEVCNNFVILVILNFSAYFIHSEIQSFSYWKWFHKN